ncbi:hypothetical protein [Urechidicola croceus]|uniref:GLPGLI family protein n=1 Tax=Urechidicola croceus TaxID=1850246 RepID=A0A1D8P415_9FLAO|nr:hypothetical protein [Urechidicola croceus]AOW19333.1 hypothetical protein LPB138_00945 [Urechidicola croceus]
MKKILLLILILSFIKANSQNKFYDYIITQSNDTIYGTIQTEINNLILREKNKSDSSKVKYYRHLVKKSVSFKYNNDIFFYDETNDSDPIYENKIVKDTNFYYKAIGNFINKSLKLKDYIITFNKDTIYGKIINPIFGKPYLVDNLKTKYKIDIEKVKSYRIKNKIYFNFYHTKSKHKFLELLVDGNSKLFFDKNNKKSYGLAINGPMAGFTISGAFYIQKGNNFVKIKIIKFKKQMVELFSENKDLINKIKNEEYTYENLPLIIKFFNESK